jgi:hypothetical protein
MTFIGMIPSASGAVEQRDLRVNYAEKDALKQGFPAIMLSPIEYSGHGAMQNPRIVSELLQVHGKKLRELGSRLKERAAVLEAVRGALPPKLAPHVATAGLENGRLTLGVTGAVWASRLRYLTGSVRTGVGAALHTEVVSVRIRVLPQAEIQALTAAGT